MKLSSDATKRNSLLFTIIVVCLSCTTTPPPEPLPVTETLSASEYLAQGKHSLTEPTAARFISLVNRYHDQYGNETRVLFDLFVNTQKTLAAYFKEKGDYFQARHHLNNLAAFTAAPTADTTQFYSEFIQTLIRRREYLTARFLIAKHKLPMRISSMVQTPPSGIEAYNKILAEISVTITTEERDDVPRIARSFGTGFLVSPTQVLTAFHIVEAVVNGHLSKRETHASITVKIQDRILEDVTVAAYDALTDIALLELPAPLSFPFRIAEMFGDSALLKQGYPVYCLAHHSGLSSTLTRGIVSAVGRKAPEVGQWIQIDANVTPGASGGLLIGEDLKVYGMVVAGLLFENINFAVPSQSIFEVLDRLRAGQPLKRPWLGLLLEQPRFKTWDPKIIEVFPTSPLSQLEVDEDAILVEINHRRMHTIAEAQDMVNSLEAGNIVHVKIENRAALKKDYWIMLERRPEFAIYNATRLYNQIVSLYPHFGFKVDSKQIHSETITYNSKTVTLNFYPVLSVREDSPLYDRGVRRGDYLGILDDYYYDKDRYLEIFHLPRRATPQMMNHITDFLYRLKKSKYDENIL